MLLFFHVVCGCYLDTIRDILPYQTGQANEDDDSEEAAPMIQDSK